jgi:8-oxo-dGTP pyrophosphatase MutT (NUDIX family)
LKVAMSKLRSKVYLYVIRQAASGPELLVFTQRGVDEGLQVPGGTVESGEKLEDAARRELLEEAGLQFTGEPRFLHRYSWDNPWKQNVHDRHVFVVDAPPGLSERWDHQVTGHGEDSGMVFQYRWIGVDEAAKELAYDFGQSVARLPAK